MNTLKTYLSLATLLLILSSSSVFASTAIVTSLNDSGVGTLRYWLTAGSADTIRFDPSLIASGNAYINLTSRIDVSRSQPLVIKGLYNSTDTLFIRGGGSWELFQFTLTNTIPFYAKLTIDSLVCTNSIRAISLYRVMQLDVRNSVFRNNNGQVSPGGTGNFDGSAIDVGPMGLSTPTSIDITLFNCSFINNKASSGGAVHISSMVEFRNINIDKCTFSGNSAFTNGAGSGGAILIRAPNDPSAETIVYIERSTFVNNAASYGGAIKIEDGVGGATQKLKIYFNNNTIVGNSCSYNSAAVHISHSTDNSNHSCAFKNNIIALNTSPGTQKNVLFFYDTNNDASSISGSYNIFSENLPIGTFSSVSNFIGTLGTINLGPLQNNGGLTKTRMPNVGSIAIDSGDPNILVDAQNLPISGVRDIGSAEFSACAQDSDAPVADINSLTNITAECSVTSLTAPTATDICAGTIIGTHNATFPITSSAEITWTYNDGNGNTSTQTQNIEITDDIAPVLNNANLSNVTSQCSVTSLTAPTATDNCAGLISGTHNAILPITNQGTTIVTWTYNDGNGNISTQTQNVIVDDNTAPVANVASLSNITSQCTVTSLTAPSATDNCAGSIVGTHNAMLPITNQGTTIVTWTYNDGNGNTSTQTQNVIVDDNTAPVATFANLSNVTSQCSVTSLTAPTATDNCAGSITGTHNATLPITNQGTTTVIWTYNDGNGNISTQTQNVVIDDVTAPIANVASLANVTSECSVTSLTAPTATDNCAGSIPGTHNVTLPITNQGTTIVTWTYNDGNGNTSTQMQNVIVDDNTAPVANVASLENVTSECSVTSLTAPTATDNCAGSITGTHNVTLPITNQGTTIVTWTYIDGNGNTSTQTQNIVINDVTAPVANVASLASVTSECSVTSLTAPTATDNCAGSITGTHNATLPITNQGTTTVIWTYSDGNGNSSIQTQDVIITPIDNGISLVDVFTLSADVSGYMYQWVDCNNGNQAIDGETNQTFIAENTGNYAVEISNGDCFVTSDCLSIMTVGLVEDNKFDVSVYPNPTTGQITIQSKQGLDRIQITNSIGQTVIEHLNVSETDFILELPEPAGVYFLNTEVETIIKTIKIIKY